MESEDSCQSGLRLLLSYSLYGGFYSLYGGNDEEGPSSKEAQGSKQTKENAPGALVYKRKGMDSGRDCGTKTTGKSPSVRGHQRSMIIKA